MPRATILLLVVALTACADESSRWAKPGVGTATVSTDLDRWILVLASPEFQLK